MTPSRPTTADTIRVSLRNPYAIKGTRYWRFDMQIRCDPGAHVGADGSPRRITAAFVVRAPKRKDAKVSATLSPVDATAGTTRWCRGSAFISPRLVAKKTSRLGTNFYIEANAEERKRGITFTPGGRRINLTDPPAGR